MGRRGVGQERLIVKRRVLVVTEDPFFLKGCDLLEGLRFRLGPDAVVSACLGPGHARCAMEDRGICGLAQAADSALVAVASNDCAPSKTA